MTIKGQGLTTISSAGTAVPLGAGGITAKYAIITAKAENAGTVFIGTSAVVASTGSGTPITAGNAATITINDLNDVYLDSTESGDSVHYTYYE